ncbi:MAG: peptidase C39 family protein [Nanoarchaeota archaeon]|nr:peptidase C39 family protein [Nanoarchaeota archaeon]
MKLHIPFYPMPKEKANYCGQFVLKPIFEYLLKKQYNIESLSKLSEKFDDGFTLTVGLAYAGLHEKLKVKYITKSKELISNEGVPDVENMYNNAKLNDIQNRAEVLLNKSKRLGLQFEIREPDISELIKEIDKHSPIVVIIDFGKIYNIDRQIFHFVIVTGYDDKNVYFHDVGPKNPAPHKKIEKKHFLKAWSALGTDMDTVIFSK